MSSLPNVPNSEQATMWSKAEAIAVSRRKPCLTERSVVGLITGALGISALLWVAIIAVL